MLRDPFVRQDPIVTSLVDDDFYKFSMLGLILSEPRMRQAQVKFAYKNRTTGVAIAQFVSETKLRQELDAAQQLPPSETELRYLGGHFVSQTTPDGEVNTRMFPQDQIDWLRKFRLPEYDLVRQADGTYALTFSGPWPMVTLWEIHALQIMSQLYFEFFLSNLSFFERQCVWAEFERRLLDKVRLIKQYPEITLMDFGTRRRACLKTQELANEVLLNELYPGQYRGTSNILLSMRQGTVPGGTNAHELPMAMSGIMHDSDETIRDSQNATFDLWYGHFGQPLSIALSDTYGTDFFLKSFGEERAHQWKGTRQDSGNPFEYGEKLIKFYQGYGIDPLTKLIIFSDGLEVDTIVRLHQRFRGRIGHTFGWGTNLANDFGDMLNAVLSQVVKLIECNGHGTVKLSDNLAKAMGTPEDVARFKRIFGYTATFASRPQY